MLTLGKDYTTYYIDASQAMYILSESIPFEKDKLLMCFCGRRIKSAMSFSVWSWMPSKPAGTFFKRKLYNSIGSESVVLLFACCDTAMFYSSCKWCYSCAFTKVHSNFCNDKTVVTNLSLGWIHPSVVLFGRYQLWSVSDRPSWVRGHHSSQLPIWLLEQSQMFATHLFGWCEWSASSTN